MTRPQFGDCDVGAFEYNPTVDAEQTVTNSSNPTSEAAQPGNTLLVELTINAPLDTSSFTLTIRLPTGVTFQSFINDAGGSAAYDEAQGEIRLTGALTPGQTVTLAYEVVVDSAVSSGIPLSFPYLLEVNNSSGEQGTVTEQGSSTVAVPLQAPVNTLVLLYYAADNNLAADGLRVLNNAEAAADNPNAVVWMMLDGPGENDAALYHVQSDNSPGCPNYDNPTCNGRYVEGEDYFPWNDNVADPFVLGEFLNAALIAYPQAEQIILTLSGHGSGISAEAPNDQRGSRNAKPDPFSGVLIDDHPAGSSLSTRELREALINGLGGSGRTRLDGLYLDACLMGMLEVAYELREQANYLLVSPNLKWANPRYDLHLAAIDGERDTEAILTEWLRTEAALFGSDTPYTYALLDLREIGDLVRALSALADALRAGALTQAEVQAVLDDVSWYDSNGDYRVDGRAGPNQDIYADLGSLVAALQGLTTLTSSDLALATAAVDSALDVVIVDKDEEGGTPYNFPDENWQWETYSGLGIYAPLTRDDWRRQFYNETHFQFAADGTWDEFLTEYWGTEPPDPNCTADEPDCQPAALGATPEESTRVYLPVVQQ